MQTLAITAPPVNEKPKPKRPIPAKRPPKAKPVRARQQAHACRQAKLWASRYVTGGVVVSAGLNAYANTMHTEGVMLGIAAIIVGIAIPVGVWVLAKVAANLYRAGLPLFAVGTGLVGVFLLALSLTHCAAAIAALTGSPLILAWLLAVGVDAGIVWCEVDGVMVEREEGGAS